MGDILLFVAAVTATVVLLTGAAAAVVLWRLRRRNRVHAAAPAVAPLSWLVSPGRPARLHRRLQGAARTAQHRPGRGRRRRTSAAPGDELLDQLLDAAVALDRQLVVAARAPWSVRPGLLAAAERQVVRLEVLAGRLAVLASSEAVPASARLGELEERLDALEVARQEIAQLEAMLQHARG